jgi:hypothetical protein
MIVRRVGPLSFAKVAGTLYAMMGLLFGCVLSLISLAGIAAMPDNTTRGAGALFGIGFGIGAIIFLPILYGGLGFVFSLIGAALYNVVAGWVGGVEMDLQ